MLKNLILNQEGGTGTKLVLGLVMIIVLIVIGVALCIVAPDITIGVINRVLGTVLSVMNL